MIMTEEQKYEHTCDRVQNVIGECEWKIRDMIEQSGLDIADIIKTIEGIIISKGVGTNLNQYIITDGIIM